MAVPRMAQHMAEQSHIGEGIGEGGAVDAEQQPGGLLPCGHPQQQSRQGEQAEGEHHRRVILDAQPAHFISG